MPLLLFGIGLALGIVINVLADNLPPDRLGMRHGPRRPHCQWCGAAHSPAAWLAVASSLLRGGRCEHCSGPRGLRAPLVELAAGLSLVFVWAWSGGHLAKFAGGSVVLMVSLLIAVIDIEHRLILWRVVLPSAVLVALVGGVTPGHGWAKTLWGGLGGYGLVFAVFLLSQLFAAGVARLRGQPIDEVAFGGGDVNLAGIIGLAVGWPGVILALLITIAAAGLFSIAYLGLLVLRRSYQPYTAAFPFGPFLIAGGLAIYFYGQQFALWYAAR